MANLVSQAGRFWQARTGTGELGTGGGNAPVADGRAKTAWTAVLASCAALSLPVAGFAADILTRDDLPPEGVIASPYSGGPVADSVVYWSIEGNYARSHQYGYGADAGFVTALNGDIGATGWTLSGSFGGNRSVNSPSDSDSIAGTAIVGYQWHQPEYYVALGAGLLVTSNDEDPSGGPTDGTKAGPVVQYGFETKAINALYAQSYGAASTAFDQLYFHAKLGHKTETIKYGVEFTASDDKGGRGTQRYGAFVGDIAVGALSMGVSAGYQDERDPGASDGIYAMVEFSVPLNLHR